MIKRKRLLNRVSTTGIPCLLLALVACSEMPVSKDNQASALPGANQKTNPPQTYGRFVPERADDFAWENDKVAFRAYGPAAAAQGTLSGIDCWFKRVDYPIINRWYQEHLSGISYHEDQGEGYDLYHTGDSRGAGGTALWIDGVPYPAGPFKTWKLISQNTQSVRFELSYEWPSPLGQVAEQKVITLNLGSQLYQVESIFFLNGKPSSLPIAIGLSTHNEAAKVYSSQDSGRISTWETIDGLAVGTGVITQPDQVQSIVHAPSEDNDASHIWLISASDDQGRFSYSAGFAWEGAGEFATLPQWNNYLDQYTFESNSKSN